MIDTGRPAYANATDGGKGIRVSAPLADIRGAAAGGAVVIAASISDLEETVHALHVGVIVSALAAALTGATAVALLLGRAFRPLGELAAAAGEIERTGDSGRRLPEIEVDDGPPVGFVTVSVRRTGEAALLSVSDEGAGLDRAAAKQAFERFWRGSHDDSGSGLGLAIVRATAERHGGRAYAEGSRFTPRRRLRVAGITAAPPHAATVTQ